jgi:excinuclease UvrABC nuclease subunit
LNQVRTITTVDSDGNETKQEIRYIDYLKDKRIELNSIMSRIGEIKRDKRKGPQLLWKWLKAEIIETFPTRNLNRAIDVPEFVLTESMEDFKEKLEQSITDYLEPMVRKRIRQLGEVKGLINKDEKLWEIRSEFLDEVLKVPKYQRIDLILQDVNKELDEDE